MKMQHGLKKGWICLLLLTVVILCLSSSVHADAARKKQWYKAPDGGVYYYNQKGKKAVGLQKIGNSRYYFDKDGRQHTGWRKIKGKYYYFTIASGKKGAMKVSAKINGITLKKDGSAKLNSYSRQKLPLLCQASGVTDSITNQKMTKKQKLRACFDYVRDQYKDFQMGGFRKSSRWDLTYARIGLIANARTKRADCYVSGCTFAYLANAVGYKVNAISSGQHGWCEIGGRIYDPAFARASRVDSFFGMDYNMSGVGGRPHFKGCRNYVIAI